MMALAATRDAGQYNITLQWQESPIFVPHKLNQDAITTPLFSHEVRLLRDAISALWAESTTSVHHYLAADIEDFVPEVASHTLDFLPAGCVWDSRWRGGASGVWRPEIETDQAPCRGLRSNLWLGAAGTSADTHFDLSHNLFFQASGTKRFRLLPPAAHRSLQLHPSWHGSHLAAQTRPAEGALAAFGGVEAVLHAGEVLFLPPGWFHAVTSRTHSVGLNLWTDSLAKDAWEAVLGDSERMGTLVVEISTRGLGELLRGTRDRLAALHAQLADGAAEDAAGARARLARQVGGLLAARYTGRAWDERVRAFWTEHAHAARASVARACDAGVLQESDAHAPPADGPMADMANRPPANRPPANEPPATLTPEERTVVREYAAALLRVEAGLRELLLDDLVEELALFVLGPVAEVVGGHRLGAAAVETFLRRCLVGVSSDH